MADDLYTQRLSLTTASKLLPIGNRAELQRWRAEVRRLLSELVTEAWALASRQAPAAAGSA